MEIEEGKIYSFKMTSGQEIVAGFLKQDDEYFYVSSPLTLGQGPQGPGFMPVMSTGDALIEELPIRKLSIAIVAPTREDIAEAYTESVDPSGLIKPEPKQIITG